MDYQCEKCPVCGSFDFRETEAENVGSDLFHIYHCSSCDHDFSSREKYRRMMAAENKRRELAERESRENDARESERREREARERAEQAIADAEQAAFEAECRADREEAEHRAAKIFRENVKCTAELACRFDGLGTSGTGIVLSNGYLLTNAHILYNPDEQDGSSWADGVFAKCPESDWVELEIVAASVEKDIAVLRFEVPAGEPVRFAQRSPETGEKIFTIGNSRGEGLCIGEGIVSDSRRKLRNQDVILISAIVTHGNSGGPLFNGSGELVGMVTNGRRDSVGMNYAIPSDLLKEYLEEVERREEIAIL